MPDRRTPDQLRNTLRYKVLDREAMEAADALLALAKRGEAYDEALIHAHNLYSQPTIRHGHVPVEAFAACMAELEQVTEERDGWRREVLVVNGQLEQGWKAKADAAEAERDRLAAALRPFAENWDFHAADYLADLVDGEEARVLPARVVNEIIAAVKVARDALASHTTQEQT